MPFSIEIVLVYADKNVSILSGATFIFFATSSSFTLLFEFCSICDFNFEYLDNVSCIYTGIFIQCDCSDMALNIACFIHHPA